MNRKLSSRFIRFMCRVLRGMTHAAAGARVPIERGTPARIGFGFAVVFLMASLTLPAFAQNFPTKPLRIVVPYGPVGGVDFVSRLLAERMGADLGQPISVDNRGGGLGLPAVNEVLKSPADGYTIFALDSAGWAITPALETVPYDFLRDFSPLGTVFSGTFIFVALNSSPVNSLQDLISLARSKPGALNFSSPGTGSLTHLIVAVLANSAGINVVHVPYKSGGEQVEAVLRGDVQFTAAGIPLVGASVKAGKFKMLAVSSKGRFSLAPEVPTVAELTGLRDFDFQGQVGFAVRAGTPAPVIQKLSTALAKAASHPDLIARTRAAGLELIPVTPEQFTELVRGDIKKYTHAVKVSGAKP